MGHFLIPFRLGLCNLILKILHGKAAAQNASDIYTAVDRHHNFKNRNGLVVFFYGAGNGLVRKIIVKVGMDRGSRDKIIVENGLGSLGHGIVHDRTNHISLVMGNNLSLVVYNHDINQSRIVAYLCVEQVVQKSVVVASQGFFTAESQAAGSGNAIMLEVILHKVDGSTQLTLSKA